MKVLVIKLGALGDVVMATALLKAIQSAHHLDQVQLLTSPTFVSLFDAWEGLGVTAFPRKGATLKTLAWLRREKFDRIYDLQSSDRSALLCALSGAKERVGNHPRYPYTHHPADKYHGQCHIFTRMNQLLASASIPAAEPQPCLPASEQDRTAVSEWLQQHCPGEEKPVLMHAGASPSWPSKRWQGFQALAIHLQDRGIPVIWIGAGDDREINQALARVSGLNATDCFSIPQLAELGRRARAAVVNDSGPMHILSASAIPVFGFFGPTSWRRNHALAQEKRVLCAEVPCSPCSLGHCPPEKNHQCMQSITAEQVMKRLEQDDIL